VELQLQKGSKDFFSVNVCLTHSERFTTQEGYRMLGVKTQEGYYYSAILAYHIDNI